MLGGVDRVSRSQVPLIPGESIRFLAALDQEISTGRATPRLVDQLARAGIGHVVIRRDLERGLTRSPHPGFAAASLARAGLPSVARFGDDGEGGPDVEVLAVTPSQPVLRTTGVDDTVTVRGAPESILRVMSSGLIGPGQASVLEGEPGWRHSADVVTDGNQRRERAFGSSDESLSALMTATEPWRTERAVHDFPSVPGAPRVVARYDRLDDLTASSAQGYADNFGPVTPQSGPYSAVDRDPSTRWITSQATDPTEQWLRVDFAGTRPVYDVSVLPVMDDREVVPIRELEVRAGDQTVRVPTNASGAPSVVRFDGREVGSVEVRVVRAGTRSERARVGIRDIEVDGLRPYRTFVLPGGDRRAELLGLRLRPGPPGVRDLVGAPGLCRRTHPGERGTDRHGPDVHACRRPGRPVAGTRDGARHIRSGAAPRAARRRATGRRHLDLRVGPQGGEPVRVRR